MISLDRYPKDITLRDGTRLSLRPAGPDDAERLWHFFRELPEIDKSHVREDVDDRDAVRRWAESVDYGTVLPIVALSEDRIVGSVTLFRDRSGWKQRVGIVRVLISPEFRHRGLGTALIREVRHVGEKGALNYLVAEVIEEQQDAIRALERMGFERAVVFRNYANDRRGHLHNLVVLLHPLAGSDEEIFY
ncbi:MAG: N-acetyltransferase family protein [Gemmatimonadota bacterium]